MYSYFTFFKSYRDGQKYNFALFVCLYSTKLRCFHIRDTSADSTESNEMLVDKKLNPLYCTFRIRMIVFQME